MKSCLTILLLCAFSCLGQDVFQINKNESDFGKAATDEFTIYESTDNDLLPEEFLHQKSNFEGKSLSKNAAAFDFTSSSLFLHFIIKNESGKDQSLVLETARPFTNHVDLFCVETKETVRSGDAIPFDSKCLPTHVSALSLFVPSSESREYVLQIKSEGENLNLPMVFHQVDHFLEVDADRKIFMGIFLGIFLFVIIIYMAFFLMLKEKLFLIYVLYATFSGLLQFSVDGFMHEYVFTSGGYFTQHCVIFIAGAVVILGVEYASRYLAISGFLRKLRSMLITLVAITMVLSLIPQVKFELPFRLINGFSLVGLIFMIVAALVQRRKIKVSNLFLIGLSCLVLGGLVFVLGNIGVLNLPFITKNALKIGTLLEMIFLAILMAGRYKTLQEEREKAQMQLLNQLEKANVQLEIQVAERTKEIESQRILLKEKNQDFMASVTYAERIQSAVLSNEDKFRNLLPDSFVLFRPKDVVSGDFYWIDELKGNKIGYVTADCTGHGVPGALVSIIGNHLLESGKAENGLLNPGRALDEVSIGMNAALNSQYASEQIRDGMDLTLCLIDQKEKKLHFSGARNSAYIIRKGELIELKGDRKSIGFNPKEETHEFQTQSFDLETGDMIYTCSDGYMDQFGGERGKKFMSKRLKALFAEISSLPLEEQREQLSSTLTDWIGDLEQLDDVLVIGVRIGE
ncbi:MAG: 7TM diverse intracellular signaling domain-containing protein [Crocinitomicaceae bacterium]|nr:7TM diverse intracellular signaling domain-containing protein [Crocinitomicaceae bacterium]